MVNTMNTKRGILSFVAVLVAGVFLVAAITPAIAFPVEGTTVSIEGAACIPAKSDVIREASSSQLIASSSPVNVLGAADAGTLPGWYLHKDAAGYGGQKPAMVSDKETLISRLAGRDVTPEVAAGTASRLVSGEGTVRFIELEGGFFGIITQSGENYRPDNLPAALKVNGTRIRFEGVVRASAPDTAMWGTPLSLITISLPSEGFSAAGTVRFIELEGGFFGIITPAGDNYLPANLPVEFQVDGIQVTFTAHEEQDIATTAMWGTPIRIDSIARYGQQAGDLGGSWSLVALDGEPLIPGTSITASFVSGRLTGNAGCNQYFSTYRTSGSSLTLGDIGSTKMYCTTPEGVAEQEAVYLSLLSRADTWSTDDGGLVIRDASGNAILAFTSGLTAEPDHLIEYSRTGGFAGFDDHLVLSSDGSGTVTRKETARSVQVPEPVMRELSAHLIGAEFQSLDDWYPAPEEGADFFTYSLTYQGKTVMTEDTGIPAVLVPIINILDEIVESSAPDDVIAPLF
jgi:heat shock protein HslJ